LALVGETIEQARDVMVFGESGILACSPADRRPEWQASYKRLIWPNGAVAQVYSAHDPDRLRGPQFDGAWVDELAKWRKGSQTWDMLQFCLRLGSDPRVCVTTTPRNVAVLKDLMSLSSTVITSATTEANRANLAKPFLQEVYRRYKGTRLGRQELEGILVTEVEGALWSRSILDKCLTDAIPTLDRVVVALDPSVSNGKGSDECGLIVAGATLDGPSSEWRAYVLADETLSKTSPMTWAKRAVEIFRNYNADRLVAEVNQGGMMVAQVIHQIDASIPFKPVHATKGKATRAEPVAALYEQGRVFHARHLDKLEDQMCEMSVNGYSGKGSPDRVDALVWALNELMITPSKLNPAVRSL
jgi:phage terminase large subunit-like protein